MILVNQIQKIEFLPDVSNLVNKIDYDAEILDIKSKYFITTDYNKFANEKLELKIKQKGLVDKSDIAGFIDNSDLNKKVATLAAKAELKAFDSSYFHGKNPF